MTTRAPKPAPSAQPTDNPYRNHPAILRIRAMSPEQRAAEFPGAIPALQQMLDDAVDRRLATIRSNQDKSA